jgi:hypothetical protein
MSERRGKVMDTEYKYTWIVVGEDRAKGMFYPVNEELNIAECVNFLEHADEPKAVIIYKLVPTMKLEALNK